MKSSYPDELSDLRRRIAAGEYQVNARRVAASMVQRLIEIARIRRVLEDAEGDRTQPASEPPR